MTLYFIKCSYYFSSTIVINIELNLELLSKIKCFIDLSLSIFVF